MRLAFALLAFPPAFAAALVVVRRLRWMPLGLAAPVALALLVCWEGVLLPALSLAHLVRPDAILVVHEVPALVVLAWAVHRAGGLRAAGAAVRRAARALLPPRARLPLLLLLPLAAILVLSGAEYAPNTWDSMTYHLARVAHWIFHRSVLVYPTFIHKQSVFPPGAEYLLLVPQALADSDRLAFGVQLLCWALAALAAAPLARALGAPRRAGPFATVLAATLPMGVLQASSTQNDLVAAVMALALVAVTLPLVHARRWRLGPGDGILLGIAGGAAWLVKPTALLAAFPFAIWGMACALRAVRASGLRAAALPALVAAAPVAAVVAAEVMRRGPFGLGVHFGSDDVYIYPLAGEWLDRALNPLRALGYHLGAAPDALRQLAPWLAPPCASGIGCGFHPLRPHEDYAGNPVHALLFLAACVLVLARGRNAPARARCTLLALAAGWVMLNVVFRSNAWVSRLHTPLFLVGVAGVAAVIGSLKGRAGEVLRVAAAGAALILAFRTALGNESRPPRLDPSAAPDAATSYYTALSALRPSHDLTLRALKTTGCGQLGLWFPGAADESFGEAWDYPLTWRARVAGAKVRTMVGPDDWPCLVYSTSGTPPSREGEPPWVSIHPRIYVRASGG